MLRALVVSLAVLAPSGCSSTSVESTWTNPALREKRITKVVVFAIAKNPGARVEFEEALTGALKGADLNVVPGYDFVNFDEKPAREAIIERVKAAGVDGALVSRVVNIHFNDSKGPQWVGGAYVPTGGWYGYYTSYAYVPVSRVSEDSATYDVETVLYLLEDEKPMWAARSKSSETSPKKLAAAIGDAVSDAFRERGVAGARPPGK
ncbi:MAG: hypothetical protein AB1938_07690 [Myxococcota bacterium]